MPDDGEQRPSGAARLQGLPLPQGPLLAPAVGRPLSSLQRAAPKLRREAVRRRDERGPQARAPAAGRRGRWPPSGSLKWVGIAALGWILLSFLAFAVSAQLQSFKLSGEAKDALHGNPFLLPSAADDPRPRHRRPAARHQGARRRRHREVLRAAVERRRAARRLLEAGEFRADTLMLIRAGGGTFRKLSIPRDSYAEIPGQSAAEDQRRLRLRRRRAADQDGRTVPRHPDRPRRDHRLHRLRRPDRRGRRGRGRRPAQALRRHLRRRRRRPGRRHRCACTRARTRSTAKRRSPTRGSASRANAPAPARAPSRLGYNDLDRAKAQQAVINGIKGRLTDPLRLPYNFIKGPIIGWDAPKAFVSDMGFFTMPQLVLAAGDRRQRRHQRPLRRSPTPAAASRPRRQRSKCPESVRRAGRQPPARRLAAARSS